MEKEHVTGAAEKAIGKVKEVTGHVVGNKKLENEGKLDQIKGSVHNAIGNTKEAGRDAIDSVKNAARRG
jgi:uncharacterized protein YjbJ (UPF0337 family)